MHWPIRTLQTTYPSSRYWKGPEGSVNTFERWFTMWHILVTPAELNVFDIHIISSGIIGKNKIPSSYFSSPALLFRGLYFFFPPILNSIFFFFYPIFLGFLFDDIATMYSLRLFSSTSFFFQSWCMGINATFWEIVKSVGGREIWTRTAENLQLSFPRKSNNEFYFFESSSSLSLGFLLAKYSLSAELLGR